MGIRKADIVSIDEYLEQEYSSNIKHEYERGEILAMSGGTLNHGIICGNIYNELRKKIEKGGRSCTVLGSEVRIHIQSVDSIVYPDSMIICGEIVTSEMDGEAVTNPQLVVKVLSKSTSGYDRGDKFFKYRQLPSLKEYVLIDQEKAVVESFFKKENNIWEISRSEGLDQSILLKSLDSSLDLAAIYQDVRWKEEIDK